MGTTRNPVSISENLSPAEISAIGKFFTAWAHSDVEQGEIYFNESRSRVEMKMSENTYYFARYLVRPQLFLMVICSCGNHHLADEFCECQL